jgi:ribulose-5-phosphate 4-epimerase/fuculose-1-phosphate aldolase
VNQLVQEVYPVIEERRIPLQAVLQLFKDICAKPSYVDPRAWAFRLNWPRDASGIDGYSDETNCIELLSALLPPRSSAMGHEVGEIFSAIRRVFEASELPPKKLSGRVVFSGVSMQTMREVQLTLGNHAYETPHGLGDTNEELPDILAAAPRALLLPREVLAHAHNYDRLVQAQVLILQSASLVCRYVLCSTFQVSISFGMTFEDPDDDRPFPAMACTAAGTDKEQLAAFADVPVVIQRHSPQVDWYGQPYRKPTSEHRSHWSYHQRALQDGVVRNLIVHFHPVELIEFYREAGPLWEPRITKEVCAAFNAEDIDLAVDDKYLERSARDASFGEFMFYVAKQRNEENGTLAVWKPNHGVWLLGTGADHLVSNLLKVQRAARRAVNILSHTGREKEEGPGIRYQLSRPSATRV